jgi:hypothetical protein
MLQKKNYPITLLQEISALLKYFYGMENRYKDIVTMTFDDPHLVEIKDVDNSGFRYVISTPSQDNQRKSYCKITKKPRGNHSLEEYSSTIQISEINNNFENWIALLAKYNEIDLSKEDMFASDEEKQFYDEFEIIEEDADFKRLSVENQFQVYTLLEQLQVRLENKSAENPEVKDIIEEAETLKLNIQNLPQSVVARKVAKLKVKIKKNGIKFFLDVVDVAYKEAIKFALKGRRRWHPKFAVIV